MSRLDQSAQPIGGLQWCAREPFITEVLFCVCLTLLVLSLLVSIPVIVFWVKIIIRMRHFPTTPEEERPIIRANRPAARSVPERDFDSFFQGEGENIPMNDFPGTSFSNNTYEGETSGRRKDINRPSKSAKARRAASEEHTYDNVPL